MGEGRTRSGEEYRRKKRVVKRMAGESRKRVNEEWTLRIG